MQRWLPTAALGRALAVGALGLVGAVLLGDPVIVVLVTPFALHACLAMIGRPHSRPSVRFRLDHATLHEGQGTVSRCVVTDARGVERATRLSGQNARLALRPVHGLVSAPVVRASAAESELAELRLEVSPRRWGRHLMGGQRLGLWSSWAGFRWESGVTVGQYLRALPVAAPFDSRAPMPPPEGLVGAHRARRSGTGTELAGVRPFAPGDRLRRINWPVTLRTGDLHVVDTLAEQDAGVLLVLDALGDHGVSRGVDGSASTLDVSVRAAAAIAEHLIRQGDRVGLRILGRVGTRIPVSSGYRQLTRVREALVRAVPGVPAEMREGVPPIQVPDGTIVIVLSPMLDNLAVGVAVTLMRRGLPTMVVDTMSGQVSPEVARATSPEVARAAWRLRLLERESTLDRLGRSGCPVVVWRGPGTLDEVLRRLARRARVPRVGVR